jgi:hypothetical protein
LGAFEKTVDFARFAVSATKPITLALTVAAHTFCGWGG